MDLGKPRFLRTYALPPVQTPHNIHLFELTIRMEQYISHQNQIWLKKEFEKFQ